MFSSMEAMECLPRVVRARCPIPTTPIFKTAIDIPDMTPPRALPGQSWRRKKREKRRWKELEAGSGLCPQPASRLSPLSATGSCDRQLLRSTTTQASLAKHVKREAGQERHEANEPDERQRARRLRQVLPHGPGRADRLFNRRGHRRRRRWRCYGCRSESLRPDLCDGWWRDRRDRRRLHLHLPQAIRVLWIFVTHGAVNDDVPSVHRLRQPTLLDIIPQLDHGIALADHARLLRHGHRAHRRIREHVSSIVNLAEAAR